MPRSTAIGFIVLAFISLNTNAECNRIKSAQEMGTLELLFNSGDIKDYLDCKRAVLERLQARLATMDGILITNIGALRLRAKKLEEERARSTESKNRLIEIQKEHQRLLGELDAEYKRNLGLKRRQSSLEKAIIDTDNETAQDEEALAELSKEIQQSEKRVSILANAVERSLALRGAQIGRSE